jgi:hypothetical protein
MPRGGHRENAGRRSTWDSGRGFSETKLIRVPIEFADQLLDFAHRLDAGESIELVTNSIRDTKENDRVQEQVDSLEKQLTQAQAQAEQLQSQLSRTSLERYRDYVISHNLKFGSQAPGYKKAKTAIDAFIKRLLLELKNK